MKKFKFTLDTVHKVREIRMEKESVILSDLQAEAEKAAQSLANLETMRQEAIENYTRRIRSGEQMNSMEMELNSNHFASLDRLQKEAEAALALKRTACARQIQLVTEAMREVKVTDNLRETQMERHQLESDRQEQTIVDELVSATFARRMSQAK
ncbi:hypothetical protein BH10ACI2_BH10ACI2_06510 [soil metagenome]